MIIVNKRVDDAGWISKMVLNSNGKGTKMKATFAQINEKLSEVSKDSTIYYADYKMSQRSNSTLLKHSRKGVISKEHNTEGAGQKIQAYGFDDLGHVIAVMWDGTVKQYIEK